MTIITTHADNLLRFYRLHNDELVQVGQLTATDALDPVVLATMAGDLTVALRWEPTANGSAPAAVQAGKPKPTHAVKKAAAPAKKRKSRKGIPRATNAESEERRQRILAEIDQHGPADAPTLGAILFGNTNGAESRVRKILEQLERAGSIVRLDKQGNAAAKYRVV